MSSTERRIFSAEISTDDWRCRIALYAPHRAGLSRLKCQIIQQLQFGRLFLPHASSACAVTRWPGMPATGSSTSKTFRRSSNKNEPTPNIPASTSYQYRAKRSTRCVTRKLPSGLDYISMIECVTVWSAASRSPVLSRTRFRECETASRYRIVGIGAARYYRLGPQG